MQDRAAGDAGLGARSRGGRGLSRDIERGPAAYLAELLGTFGLVFFITMALSLFALRPAQEGAPAPFIDWSVIGLVHVFALFMLIQTLAVISGAHFNPAVTAAMAAIRQIRPVDAAIYILAQLSGAILGALLTKLLLHDFVNADQVNYGALALGDNIQGKLLPGIVAELVGTFFLVWAIVGVAVSPGGLKDWSGFAIGATLGLVVMLIGPLTGAGFNPARAFGPALVSGQFDGFSHFVFAFVLAPVAGAILAAVAYSALFMQPGKKGVEGMEPVG